MQTGWRVGGENLGPSAGKDNQENQRCQTWSPFLRQGIAKRS